MNNMSRPNERTGLARLLGAAGLFASLLLMTLPVNAAPQSTNAPQQLETATFGGGCFWCMEAVFQRIPGVKSVVSGYAGGRMPNPNYGQVSSGETGYAEVVQIKFDPAIISYGKLLQIFWEAHDPTTFDRQGNDIGTQYRSIVLYSNQTQKRAAEKSRADAARHFSAPITTQIVPLKKFYPAAQYYQNYYNQHQSQPYCQSVIAPKLRKLIDAGAVPAEKK